MAFRFSPQKTLGSASHAHIPSGRVIIEILPTTVTVAHFSFSSFSISPSTFASAVIAYYIGKVAQVEAPGIIKSPHSAAYGRGLSFLLVVDDGAGDTLVDGVVVVIVIVNDDTKELEGHFASASPFHWIRGDTRHF